MIQTSQAWKDYAKNNFIYHIQAELTSTDGYTLYLGDDDFMMGSVSIEDSISDDTSFTVGSVVTNRFSCTLNNTTYKYDAFNFSGATISVHLGIIYEDYSEEWIDRGIYRVEQPDSLGSTIQLEAYDFMDKMNTYYTGKTLSSREVSATNLFDSEAVNIGYWIDDNGETIISADGYYSDFISVTDGTSYVAQSTFGNIICYDSSKTFIGAVPLTYINELGLIFTASIDGQSVSYIRKNGYKEELENDFVCELLGTFGDISFPISSSALVEALANYCGVEVSSDFWDGVGRSINEFTHDESTTCRQVLSWVLQINGRYGRMDESGQLVCSLFDSNVWENAFSTTDQLFYPWGQNILDTVSINDGVYVNPSTGNPTSSPINYSTDYISVTAPATYYCSSSADIPRYNSSKTYIGALSPQRVSGKSYFSVYIPSATAYVKFNGTYATTGATYFAKVWTPGMCFVDGGEFTNWLHINARLEDGGEFMSGSKVEFNNVMQSNVSVYDIAVTGVCAYANTDSEDSEFAIAGSDGYMLTLSDNPLITTDNMQQIASSVYNLLKSIKFRIFDASVLLSPDVEAGDSCVVEDYRGRFYPSLITNLSYNINRASDISAAAETPEDNGNQTANASSQVMSSAVSTAISISKDYSDAKLVEAKDYSDDILQDAKDYTDDVLTKRAWGFTSSNISTIHYNDVVVNNGVAMGGIKFKFNSSGSGWRQLGTTTDIPHNDVTFPLINLSGASWLGELQVRTDGTVQAYYASTYANDAFATIVYDIEDNN